MSDEPPGFNAPRRKARFSSRYDQEQYRRPVLKTPSAEPALADAAPTDGLPDAGTAPTEVPTPAAEAPGSEQADLLPNFRLNKVYEDPPSVSNPFKDWRWLLLTVVLLVAGLGGGYALGRASLPARAVSKTAPEPEKMVVGGLSPEVQAQVDAAFQATKKSRYQEARAQFDALRQQHPEWWSMGIESARASLYLHDAQTAKRTLNTITTDAGLPDANFIQALLHLTNKEFDLAEAAFAIAAAHDPSRPDFFYFWGECLRRDGKPLEAADKFRAALLRNQYENAEGLYQLKFWLSQVQADQEEASGANKAIDAVLASPHPSYEALLAAAAREMKARNYPKAVELITRARTITEPAVFRVIMQDAIFVDETPNHPELMVFYR